MRLFTKYIAMPNPTKRLVLFFDGTDNTPKDRTNVWRAHELLADVDRHGVPQLKKYIKGVGTDMGFRVRGSIFGEGVITRMCEGYEWLVANYEKGSEIYVFGFSRGAFTARSLVQMIATCGLMKKETMQELSVRKLFDRYEAISLGKAHPIWRLRYFKKDLPSKWTPNAVDKLLLDGKKIRVVKVRMAGLWDTVGAMGADAIANQGAVTQKSAAHNVRPTKAQEYGYHAVAIDEHRPMFDVTCWRTFVEEGKEESTLKRYAKYYEQRWFVGAHSDVGGGYLDDRLPDISLAWMQSKSSALGLEFKTMVTPVVGGWSAPIHDSFKKFAFGILNIWAKVLPGNQRNYREVGRVPKSVKTAEGTKGILMSVNEVIDPSVFERWKSDASYRPQGLIEYFRRNPDQEPVSS